MELTSLILLHLRKLWTLEGEAFKLCPECPILQLAELIPDLCLWESLPKTGTSLAFPVSQSCVIDTNTTFRASVNKHHLPFSTSE